MIKKIGMLLFISFIAAACSSPKDDMEVEAAEQSAVINKSPAQVAVEKGLSSAVSFVGEPLQQFSIDDRMQHFQVPGVAFALINDGDLEWSGAYGLKEVGSQQRVDESTLFQAASIAKPVVAFAVMRMVDQGIFDLDAPISEYLDGYELPNVTDASLDQVTLRNVLAHTSGITAGGYAGYEQGKTLPTDLQILKGEKPANTAEIKLEVTPNTVIGYSGGGYTLIEYILVSQFNKPFADIMQEWVLGPLQMHASTYAQPLPDALHKKVAKAHDPDGSVVKGGWNNYPEQAAAGLWTTADDLALFVIELRNAYLGNSELLSQTIARDMLTPLIDDAAVGILVRGEGDRFAFRHAGGNRGYSAYFVMHVDSGDGAVYLSNTLGGWMLREELLRSASSHYGWSENPTEMLSRIEAQPDVLRTLAGKYKMNTDWQVQVQYSAADNQIALIFPNNDNYPLVPIGNGEFVYQGDGTKAKFVEKDGNQNIALYGQEGIKD